MRNRFKKALVSLLAVMLVTGAVFAQERKAEGKRGGCKMRGRMMRKAEGKTPSWLQNEARRRRSSWRMQNDAQR